MNQNTDNKTELEKKARGKKEKIREIVIVIGSGLLIFATWWGSGFWINANINPDYRGIVGDMFGAVNALFSGLAFAGLIYTITVQRKELSLQREAIQMQTKELEAQHIETARSADQLQMQQELMNYQLILSTVNDLIKLKNEAVIRVNIELKEELMNYQKQRQEKRDNMRRMDMPVYEINANQMPPLKQLFQASRKQLRQFEETSFFILQFIIDNKLPDKQINDLKKIVKVNLTEAEVETLKHVALEDNDQHRLALLAAYNFID